jgi:quercetin dioxygenase-like cupin family protein
MTSNASALPATAFVETADSAPRFWQIGLLWRLLATGHKTGGALCFVDEINGSREGGPVTHTHPQDEGLYLVEGHCTFHAGGQTIEASPGTFVAVPRHTQHAFMAAPGCRFLNFYLPAGFEMMVMGLGTPALRNEPPGAGEFTLPPRALVDKLGWDYGQFPVLGTPFADPPLRENMTTAPSSGASALPYASRVDTARSYWNNGILWSILADSDTTDGSYSLFEELCPKGAGAPPHVHLYADEVFYMLEGEAEFLAGDVRQVAGAGSLVFVPRGTVHAFRVRSDTAKMLNLYTQAGFERLIEATGRPAMAKTLPPPDLKPNDIPAPWRARLFAEIGMQAVAWPDPFA